MTKTEEQREVSPIAFMNPPALTVSPTFNTFVSKTHLVPELFCRHDVQERTGHLLRYASAAWLREIPRRALPTRSRDAMIYAAASTKH